MHAILQTITAWVTETITRSGYWGIFIMMGIESACIPLPSEIIMPFGGYLVSIHPERFTIWWMGVAGAAGCIWGSVVAYAAGKYGGRPLVERYGKYFFVRHQDLDRADAWFVKYGEAAVFICRLLPVVRTFISFPAGMAKVNFWRFILYTFLGSLPWCIALAWAGKILGDNWDKVLKKYFHGADALIIGAIVILVALYVWHHVKSEREYRKKQDSGS